MHTSSYAHWQKLCGSYARVHFARRSNTHYGDATKKGLRSALSAGGRCCTQGVTKHVSQEQICCISLQADDTRAYDIDAPAEQPRCWSSAVQFRSISVIKLNYASTVQFFTFTGRDLSARADMDKTEDEETCQRRVLPDTSTRTLRGGTERRAVAKVAESCSAVKLGSYGPVYEWFWAR